MKTRAVQLNPTVGDLDGNGAKIIAGIDEARSEKIDLVIFPEMALVGYPPEDLVLHKDFVEKVEAWIQKIVTHTDGLMAIVGCIRASSKGAEKRVHNSAVVMADGKLLGYVDKRLLPTYDVFDEARYFAAGIESRIWEWRKRRIAILICEDIWQHAEAVMHTYYLCDPVEELKGDQPDLLINISASPFHFQKVETRLEVARCAAKTLGCPHIMCCQVGANDQLVFDGYSSLVDSGGKLLALAKGFEEDTLTFELENLPQAHTASFDHHLDLYQALILGVRDYFHKMGFHRAHLGLSGGIDSALVACIAVKALGAENVTGVMMPSRYSSKGSIDDSLKLAENLGIAIEEISIQPLFDKMKVTLLPFFKGLPEDVTEENIQPRLRGMVLMALSNKFDSLVLCCGNKSEFALGYTTLYGDMCGGLSVISDLLKTQVYDLSRWINRGAEVIPQAIIDKAPSAELKEGQVDLDSLPEYAIIDSVIRGYVEKQLSHSEIAEAEGIEPELVVDLVRRIHCAEYKRRQGAPGIRVSEKSFLVGHRYPIVQKV